MAIARKIPATVVTGFLGAGKTTMIRNLIEQANGRKPVSYTHLTLPTNREV